MMSAPSNAAPPAEKIIFVTGTDTDVGKTLLTGLLVFHLRQSGCHALAMKPFCSGSMADVDFLRALQERELRRDEIAPFYFAEPVAPLVAARIHRRQIRLTEVLERIRQTAARCEGLIVEGCGGLLAPLGEGYTAADLIRKLNCRVIVVSRNRLGTINHTLLTVDALRTLGATRMCVALADRLRGDFSTRFNRLILRQLLAPVRLLEVPYLGPSVRSAEGVKKKYKKVKKTLAQLADGGSF